MEQGQVVQYFQTINFLVSQHAQKSLITRETIRLQRKFRHLEITSLLLSFSSISYVQYNVLSDLLPEYEGSKLLRHTDISISIHSVSYPRNLETSSWFCPSPPIYFLLIRFKITVECFQMTSLSPSSSKVQKWNKLYINLHGIISTRDCNLYQHDSENLKYVGGKSVLLSRNTENLHNAKVCSKIWRDAILRVTGKLHWFLAHTHDSTLGFHWVSLSLF